MMIRKGADVNALDLSKRTPIFYLFFKNALPSNSEGDPVNVFMDIISMKKIDLKAKDVLENTPLHYACGRGSTICALSMINLGAPINEKNIFGNTPFDLALTY